MRLLSYIIAGVIIGIPAVAAARPAETQAPVMALGVAARAPSGFADLCVRHPRDCLANPATADDSQVSAMKAWASQSLWASIFANRPLERPASVGFAYRPAPIADRNADEALTAPADEVATSPPAAEPVPAVAAVSMDALRRINTGVNRTIISATDSATFGAEDFWAAPEDRGRYGDCEDYVLAKRAALIEAGTPRSALSIALVETFRGELHAVLLVATDKGEVVLDNLSPRITPWQKAPYRWRVRQVAGSAQQWATVTSPGVRRWW